MILRGLLLPAVMWRDILLHNKEPLLDLLEKWQVEMDKIHTFIKQGDKEEIYRFLKEPSCLEMACLREKKVPSLPFMICTWTCLTIPASFLM